ncbi:unnamed protein product [Triticum turgidum subsp. durum]|uniref:Uncharacterized protein n=1 Tax=Triticum turgidum subsp. durum TaxID=4567 RepID=A0A9R1P4J8_TRITD|nr:unnamed protein product [Triticum turgidum subsp. durum]
MPSRSKTRRNSREPLQLYALIRKKGNLSAANGAELSSSPSARGDETKESHPKGPRGYATSSRHPIQIRRAHAPGKTSEKSNRETRRAEIGRLAAERESGTAAAELTSRGRDQAERRRRRRTRSSASISRGLQQVAGGALSLSLCGSLGGGREDGERLGGRDYLWVWIRGDCHGRGLKVRREAALAVFSSPFGRKGQ